MKNKNIASLLITLLLTSSIMSGCGKHISISESSESQESHQESIMTEASTDEDKIIETESQTSDDQTHTKSMLEVSNLADEESCQLLKSCLLNSGVSEERIKVLFDHIDQFQEHIGKENLISGFQALNASEIKFDEYALQDLWYAKEPEFLGYNCRITAYMIMADRIGIEDITSPDTRNIYLDLDALESDSSALQGDSSDKFQALFTTIEGDNTDEQAVQIKHVEDEFEKRKITFDVTGNLSLIELYLHTKYDENDNELFVGHTGVLMDMGQEGLYFLEKLAFQAPYRFIKLNNRNELKDYLLTHYASYRNDGEAAPFILENGKTME